MNGKIQFLEKELNKLFEQAKEMEKQQIIKAVKHGVNYKNTPFENAEQYYNETF
jgi:hypothetical protein